MAFCRSRAVLFALLASAGAVGCNQDNGVKPGTVYDEATLSVNQTVLDFGRFAPLEESTIATFEFKNIGALPTGPVSIRLDNLTEFKLVGSGCGNPLQSLGSCQVQVKFAPQSHGAKSATLSATANPGSQVSVTLLGNGLLPASLSASPGSYEFGKVLAATAGEPPMPPTKAFVVTNNGGVQAGPIKKVNIEGKDAVDFVRVDDSCSGVVLPPTGGTCMISVRFRPQTPGPKSATITFEDTDIAAIGLSGFGTEGAILALTPSTMVTFPETALATKSSRQVFRIENKGEAEATSLAVDISNSQDFELDKTGCGDTLQPRTSCLVGVVFSPQSLGQKSGSLVVSASPGIYLTADVTGKGVSKSSMAQMKVTGQPAFGAVILGQSSSTLFTVESTGMVAIGKVVASISGTHQSDFKADAANCPDTLEPGATCFFTVTFTPTGLLARSAYLQVTTVPGGTQSFPLTGTGSPGAELDISPKTRNFGDVTVNRQSTNPYTFTVRNTGMNVSGALMVRFEGTDPTEFTKSQDSCDGTMLNPDETCIIGVRFSPHTIGANGGYKEATLVISATPGDTTRSFLTGRAR